MGVQGLWELLAPVGRRVSVETLAGKKLAIDASIWMVQFMKAMRDERGEMVRNAHILGFFRRICKLLFLHTKPVFVFDGGTPALKRRTVIARRRQRENAQAKIRKTAEKLLLNHLKEMRLKELANDIENQRQKNDLKGKNVVPANAEVTEKCSKTNDKGTEGYDQEALDELLAASLAAEEDGSITTKASTSVGRVAFEEEDDEDEEMILPTMHGKIDPSVLASLPPSMQLELLVQMREGLMAENRQKYQKVKKAPAKFSELQIQAYLKTVAFRREIIEVQKTAAGRGVGGVQTSRIASESNREFIFSSSFTGDKEILASAGVKKNGEVERREARKEPASSDTAHCISSITQTSSATAAGENELRRDFDDGVETYIDERGFRRVSRVRAMGICMTRDLQRNLDLMKEIEQEKMKDKTSLNLEAMISERVDGSPDKFPGNNQLPEASDEIISSDDGTDMLVRSKNQKIHEQSILENRTPIEISFLEDESSCRGRDDDDLFANLVAGNSILVSSAENASSSNPSCVNASDCSWKEGIDDEKGGTLGNDPREECGPSLAQGNSDESEVDWEEGDFDVPRNASSSPSELNNVISRGCLEEEADIQEAIRRSLEDSTPKKSPMTSTENKNTKISIEMINQSTSGGFPCQVLTPEKDSIDSLNFPRENDGLQCQISSPQAGLKHPDQIGERDTLCVNNSPGRQLESSIAFRIKTDKKAALIDKPYQTNPVSSLQVLSEEVSENKSVYKEIPCTYLVPLESTELHLTADQFLDTFNEVGEVTSFTGSNGNHRVSSRVSAAVTSDLPEDMLVDGHQDKSEAVPTYHLYEVTENDDSQGESLMKGVACGAEKHLEQTRENFSIQDNMEVQIEKEGASLDEEMLLLREERRNLGEEQRKLERNAEAVSSEMFAECQELLQMFGLPYIIAPMEAEAQCAYMELSNLVDGVVTDDSDVFLFGARSVYKNIFDDRKYVETYFMKDIENELGLTREQLIRMALLLGSDYTEGVSGIGIVNAIEVVHAFPEEDGLQQFREWLESPDPTILGNFDAQTGSTSRKRGSKLSSNDVEAGSSGDKSISTDNIPKIKQIFMDKHRNVSKNWHIPSAFPSETVISAYVTPQVDKSTEPFSWGKPDLFVLRKLCWEKFGWSNQKVDELLVPVLKEHNKHETQLRLEAFYTFNERFAKIRSKRIKKALKGITGNRSSELMDDLPQEASKARKKCASPTGPLENKLENSLDGNKGSLAENKKNTSEKSNSRQSRKRTESEPMPSEVGHSEPPIQNKGRRNTKKGSGVNVRGRGRRRGRGRGRGRRIEGPSFESSETSCSDEDDELEMQDEITERSTEVRRSKRPRKHVKYAGNDVEADGLSDSSEHQNDGNCKDGAVEQETLLGKEMFGGVAHDVIKEKVGSSPLQDAFSSDDLGMGGGGFCADEGEPEIENVPNQTRDSDLGNGNGNPSVQDEFSRDYLKMGGGFCMDEDEADNNIIESVSSPRRTDYSNELVDMGRMNDDDAAAAVTTRSLDSPNTKGKDEATNVGMPLEEADDSTQPKIATTTDGLKAMPFLKRKRRNN